MSPKHSSLVIDSAAAGRRIRQRREQLVMTPTELAKAIGLKNPNTIKNYEINGRIPRVEYLARLAVALETSIDWILLGGRALAAKRTITVVPLTQKKRA